MKKLLALLLVLLSFGSFAQSSIKCQIKYLPDQQYNIETKNITQMVMDVLVDDATKQQLKASGVNFPMTMDMNQDMTALLKTGKLNDKKEVPITMEYTQFKSIQKMGGNELPSQPNPAQGMKIIGWGDSQGKFRVENIEGTGVTEQTRKIIVSMVDQVGTNIAFPQTPLKVGDEFTQEVPLSIPVQGGAEMKMKVITVYKLKSFDSNNAFFDSVITMTLDMTVEKGTMGAEGGGKGTLVYDVKKNFVSGSSTKIDMVMKIKAGAMDMDIKSSTQSDVKVTYL
jgi:hypothetical protein